MVSLTEKKSASFVKDIFLAFCYNLNPLSASPTKWSNTVNNTSATVNELFECV